MAECVDIISGGSIFFEIQSSHSIPFSAWKKKKLMIKSPISQRGGWVWTDIRYLRWAAVVAFQLLLHYAWLLRSTQMMTTFRSFFNPPLTLTRFRIDLPPRYFSLWPFILVVELRKNLFVLAIFQAAATSKIVNFMNFGDVQNYGLPLKISQKNLHTIMTYG